MNDKLIVTLLFSISFLMSCTHSEQSKKNNTHAIDTLESSSSTSYFDSLANVTMDTTTLVGKRQKILNTFIIENSASPDFDTLFDLTYDGYKDYVIGYYGLSGTGLKNSVKVYLFDPKLKSYILNEHLSNLPNPTFYISQKKITSFYIGNGGGAGKKLEWIENKWTLTKEFEVDNEGATTKWKINYPLKNKTKVLLRPFQMIPPQDILESAVKLEF